MPDIALLAQGFALLVFLIQSTAACLLYLPIAIFKCSLISLSKPTASKIAEGCTFYEGTVFHERRSPVRNAFRCVCTAPHQLFPHGVMQCWGGEYTQGLATSTSSSAGAYLGYRAPRTCAIEGNAGLTERLACLSASLVLLERQLLCGLQV